MMALAGCAGVLPDAEARYTGRDTPQAACGVESSATLVVRGSRFSFAPTDGVLSIAGDVAPDRTLGGSLSTPGVARTPFVMTFSAKMVGSDVIGTYSTPRCRFDVVLRRR